MESVTAEDVQGMVASIDAISDEISRSKKAAGRKRKAKPKPHPQSQPGPAPTFRDY